MSIAMPKFITTWISYTMLSVELLWLGKDWCGPLLLSLLPSTSTSLICSVCTLILSSSILLPSFFVLATHSVVTTPWALWFSDLLAHHATEELLALPSWLPSERSPRAACTEPLWLRVLSVAVTQWRTSTLNRTDARCQYWAANEI